MIKLHSYIDAKLRKDFSDNKVCIENIMDELLEDYKIKNIRYDEDDLYLYYIANTLNNDYAQEILNYRSYIEKNMSLGMLLELRRSAIIPVDKEHEYFYTNHSRFDTIEEVRKYRIEFMKKATHPEYEDEDWQLFYILKLMYGSKRMDYTFLDLRCCFEGATIEFSEHEREYREQYYKYNDFPRTPDGFIDWYAINNDPKYF